MACEPSVVALPETPVVPDAGTCITQRANVPEGFVCQCLPAGSSGFVHPWRLSSHWARSGGSLLGACNANQGEPTPDFCKGVTTLKAEAKR